MMTNSVGPDEMGHCVRSHVDIHCVVTLIGHSSFSVYDLPKN